MVSCTSCSLACNVASTLSQDTYLASGPKVAAWILTQWCCVQGPIANLQDHLANPGAEECGHVMWNMLAGGLLLG